MQLIVYTSARQSCQLLCVELRLCEAPHKRKNFLFVGNDAGGERAASFYSIIETCKLNGVEPFAYLCDVLEKLPTWPNKRLHELLPWNWKKLH